MSPWLLAAFISAQTLDGTTTAIGLHRGYHEAWPWLPDRPAASIALKAGVATGIYLAVKPLERRHPTVGRSLFYAALIGSAVAGTWNVRQLQRSR